MHSLTDRYVHAATRTLPEEQRADVARELEAGIADRVDAVLAERPDLGPTEAERRALVELGDPDRLAAGYAGSPLHLVGPALYPAYVRTLKGVTVVAVPTATAALAVIEALDGAGWGGVLGRAAWMAFTLTVQIAFWVTLAFAVVERSDAPARQAEGLGVGEWDPDSLPAVPADRASLGEAVFNVVWLGLLAAAIGWQHLSSPLWRDGERVPVLDPDLWSFWLPLVLVLLVVEAAFEVVKHAAGRGWTRGFAAANTALGALFAAPVVLLAAEGRLLNPTAVAEIQEGWSGFDPGTVHTVVLLAAVGIWVWDSVEGWRRARSA
ncbi:permease prefix domain 1-containing protein [Nocardioides solisilvae]|uniref:permease prefix domain 1-containing protein n=1 Tax=Nocardioides solisilvae TaxID=1542435 RepID=UPI000D741127|nr:permease prefix domain 1-containing protein [Nocardioides solisilvae]